MSGQSNICVVVGAGTKYASNPNFKEDDNSLEFSVEVKWGLGGALPIAFAKEGYRVVIMSRSLENLAPIQNYIQERIGGECLSVRCDVGSNESVQLAFEEVRQQWGEVDVLCYNAGYDQGNHDNIVPKAKLVENIDLANFETAHSVHTSGLLHCAKQVLPGMRERGNGSLLVSGNSMCVRGSPDFGLNAPSKFAQRGLTQVMAQEYKPFGVHVGLVIIDGAIDAPGMRKMLRNHGRSEALDDEANSPGSYLLDPGEIANTFVDLAHQHGSVWTHEISLTPYKVTLGQRL